MTANALLLDTKAWILAIEGSEDGYAEALATARPAIVPGLVLAEVDYWLKRRRRVMHDLLRDIAGGAYEYEAPTAADLARAREIDAKFSRTGLGLVDASIAALGERLGVYRVLTTDSDFASVRVGKRWNVSFELAVPLPVRPG
jgi:predicted nucleic acid-binding protein